MEEEEHVKILEEIRVKTKAEIKIIRRQLQEVREGLAKCRETLGAKK